MLTSKPRSGASGTVQRTGRDDYGVGVTQEQLERRLKDVPGFAGVYAADELPDMLPGTARKTDTRTLIVNACTRASGGCHWVAMKTGTGAWFFSSYGLAPDQSDSILKTRTRFARWLSAHSVGGRYKVNRKDLQSVGTAVCGDYAAYAVLNGMPTDPDGPEGLLAWRRILDKRTSWGRDKAVRRLARVTSSRDIGSSDSWVTLVRPPRGQARLARHARHARHARV